VKQVNLTVNENAFGPRQEPRIDRSRVEETVRAYEEAGLFASVTPGLATADRQVEVRSLTACMKMMWRGSWHPGLCS
jgi:hypothetical protein